MPPASSSLVASLVDRSILFVGVSTRSSSFRRRAIRDHSYRRRSILNRIGADGEPAGAATIPTRD
jgi:hypothetical protein